MTQTDRQDTRTKNSNPVRILWLVAGALALGCLCSLGGLYVLRRAGTMGWVQDLWPMAGATATYQPAPMPGATRTVQVVVPTAKADSTPAGESTATTAPTQTAAAEATPTPRATFTPAAPQASPTPFTCDSLYELANIHLVPGQTFQCTLRERELTDLANSYPDSPCSEVRFAFDDGEIGVECRMGLWMRAVLEPKMENCRIEIAVVRGTPGFRQIVQELIATQFDVIKYDTICVERADIDDGEIDVAGYGR